MKRWNRLTSSGRGLENEAGFVEGLGFCEIGELWSAKVGGGPIVAVA